MLLIAGPTAGGKSALALRLAERHRGVVINADSMAVYRDLRILTGRPNAIDEASVPHWLFGHQDAASAYSVALWLAEAGPAIEAARANGRLPIVVGGTGLYFKAMTQGLSDIPAVPEDLRERLRAEAKHLSAEELHARLAARDPEMAARLLPTDPQRVLRAIEVLEATGRSLAFFQGRRRPPLLGPDSYMGIVIEPEKHALREVIDRRFDEMMEQGALDEVARLAARSLDPSLPAMRALGVPPLLDYLDKRIALNDAVARAKSQTRAYAKRQITFARHQLPNFSWTTPAQATAQGWPTWQGFKASPNF